MSLYDRLRLAARLGALAPVFLVGLPLQALLLRFSPRAAARAPVVFHRLVCRILGLKIRLVTPMPGPGAMLIVSNHVSWLDIVVIGALRPVSFIAKSEVAGWPGAGMLARLQRTLFVDRQNRRAAAASATAIAGRLAADEAIVLFAEGTTSDGNRVLPFRSALLAAACPDEGSAVPVQPMALVYARQNGLPAGRRERPGIAWYGDMDLAPHLVTLLSSGAVDVAVGFGEPLAGTTPAHRKALARAAEDSVRALVQRAGQPPAPAGSA